MKYLVLVIIIIAAYWLLKKNANPKAALANIEQGEQFLADNLNTIGVHSTSSGLQYLELEPGKGTLHPRAQDKVQVHYQGSLINGQVFDSSYERGQPASFALNQVIAGWTEGLQLMVEGQKMRFFIPSHIAYGKRNVANIPGGSLLIFDVELLAINP